MCISEKYKTGHAVASNALLEHSCNGTEVQFSLILTVKTLMTDSKLNLLYTR